MPGRRSAVVAVLVASAIPATANAAYSPVRVRAPHALPGGVHAARTATWIVGARPSVASERVARRFAARRVTPRGIYVLSSTRARAFARALRREGLYRFSEPDRRLAPLQAPAAGDDFAATDWRQFLVGSTPAPDPAGAPLTAVIDSAVDTTHPDLAGIEVTGDPAISDLHGTAVASVVGGRANSFGMVGIFPGAPILSVGSGLLLSDITRAIAASVKAGAKQINMSLGGPQPEFAMFVEIAYAVSQDVAVVASAGNDFDTVLPDGTQNPVMFPAAFPHVVSVASMGPSGASSSFSTANGAVDLTAPGESVLTAVPPALDDDGTPDGFERLDGTSFAAPIVTGELAWLRTARRDLSAAQASDLLRITAKDLGPAGFDNDSGYGQVDILGALAGAKPPEDTLEVNDDMEWVDGRRFSRPDPFFYRGGAGRRGLTAVVDYWKDPADVYRFKIGCVSGRSIAPGTIAANANRPAARHESAAT